MSKVSKIRVQNYTKLTTVFLYAGINKNGIKSTIHLDWQLKLNSVGNRKGKCILKSIIAEKNGEIC